MGQSSCEMRVLAGPQTGARLTLKTGASVDVGSLESSGCQVVLRDPLVREQRVRLHVRSSDVRIEVLAGEVDLAGQRLVAPCSVNWPLFMPLQIGETVLAVGHASSANDRHWAGALQRALATNDSDGPTVLDPRTSAHHDPEAASQSSPPRRSFEVWLAVGGAVLTLAAASLWSVVSLTPAAAAPTASVAQRSKQLLQASSAFAGLKLVAPAQAHEPIGIQGNLLTLADRAKLERALADAQIDAALQVRVGEEIDMAIRDVYRMHGITAQTSLPSALSDVGSVQVKTQERDEQRLQNISTIAQRDVTGLVHLQVANTLPQVVAPAPPVVDDPGKRVASIVTGATPYVVTADGTRYFIGALLPSGHRIAAISDQQVMLDKDHKLTPLRF
jgi:type III secretion protein D